MKNALFICILFLLILTGFGCADSGDDKSKTDSAVPKNFIPTPATTVTPTNTLVLKEKKPSKSGASSSLPADKSSTSPATSAQRNLRYKTSPPATVQSGATAKCRDGSVSYSRHRRGTCSHHGGVAEWY